MAQSALADPLRFSGNSAGAAETYSNAQRSLDELRASDPKNIDWNITTQSMLDLIGARIADASGSIDRANLLSSRAITRLAPITKPDDENNSRILAGLSLLAGDLAARSGNRPEALAAWRRASAAMGKSNDASSLKLAYRYAADRRLGEDEDARAVAALLDRRGFRHPYYVQERALVRRSNN